MMKSSEMLNYERLSDTTRVWIYQSDRPFTESELPAIRDKIRQFAQSWVSHNRQLQAFGEIYYQQFIVLMVDESQAGASGCSIDASVHFIQHLQQEYGVNMFDRMLFSYKQDDRIYTAPKEQFERLYQQGIIDDSTLVFDNLVKNKEEFEERWLIPLGESWHKKMVQ